MVFYFHRFTWVFCLYFGLNNYSKCQSEIDYNKVLNNCNILLENEPNNGFYLESKGIALINLDRFIEAKAVLILAIKNDSSLLNSYYSLAYLYKTENQLDSTIIILDKAIKRNIVSSDILYLKGVVLYDKKKYNDAILSFENSLKSGGDTSDNFHAISLVYFMTKNYSKVITLLNKGLPSERYELFNYLLIYAYIKLNEFHNAKKIVRKIEKSKNDFAYYYVAYYYHSVGKKKKACYYFSKIKYDISVKIFDYKKIC